MSTCPARPLEVVGFACFLFAGCLGTGLPINQKATIPDAVEDYSRDLNIIRSGAKAGPGTEELLQRGRRAAKALLQSDGPGSMNVLERLTAGDFQKVVLKMEGFLVNREETVYVEPDPGFFLALAKRFGDRASIDFFEAFRKTAPDAWPVYIQQQTDYSGCARFGSLSLVETYGRWTAFRTEHPKRYSAEVAVFLRRVEEELTEGNCACEGKDAVLSEVVALTAPPQPGCFVTMTPEAQRTNV